MILPLFFSIMGSPVPDDWQPLSPSNESTHQLPPLRTIMCVCDKKVCPSVQRNSRQISSEYAYNFLPRQKINTQHVPSIRIEFSPAVATDKRIKPRRFRTYSQWFPQREEAIQRLPRSRALLSFVCGDFKAYSPKYYQSVRIRDRPSTLTSYSICDLSIF